MTLTLQHQIRHTNWSRMTGLARKQLIKQWLRFMSVQDIISCLHSEHPQDLDRVYKTLDSMGLLYQAVYEEEA